MTLRLDIAVGEQLVAFGHPLHDGPLETRVAKHPFGVTAYPEKIFRRMAGQGSSGDRWIGPCQPRAYGAGACSSRLGTDDPGILADAPRLVGDDKIPRLRRCAGQAARHDTVGIVLAHEEASEQGVARLDLASNQG